ncbi:MAG: hypothetical protein GF408_04395 [Candidatus Omnitrophica bacterium]|nr:hypothetical protein [Candidatus Omnitrophota bacterium]
MKPLFTKTIKIKTDKDNRLILEHATRFVLEGAWSLSDDHALGFKVRSSDSYLAGKKLIFHGEVENVKGDSLRFRIRKSEPLLGVRSGTIELKGKWHADKDNVICFSAARSSGRYDVLRFRGIWEAGKNNELTYKYDKTWMKTGDKEVHTFVFAGFWEFEKHKLIYRIERSDESVLSFRATLASRRIGPSDNAIKYRVGVIYKYRNTVRTKRKTVSLYGKWYFTRDFRVGFRLEYSGRRKREAVFDIERFIGRGASFKVSVKGEDGKPMGLEVEFRKVFPDDIELFMALSHAGEESRIEGGVKVKF